MKYDVELVLENKKEFYAFGQVAKQSNGAAWLKCGDTVILATVVIDDGEDRAAFRNNLKKHCSKILQPFMIPMKIKFVKEISLSTRFKRIRQ